MGSGVRAGPGGGPRLGPLGVASRRWVWPGANAAAQVLAERMLETRLPKLLLRLTR